MSKPQRAAAGLPREPIAAVLRRIPIMRDLDQHGLAEVERVLTRVHVEENAVVFREGDPGDAFYVISSGRLRVASDVGPASIPLAHLGPGQYFGEMALITGQPRTAAVIAETGSELLRISASDFDGLIHRLPALGAAMARAAEHRAGGGHTFENEAYEIARLASGNRQLTIGSDPANDIVLHLPGVAPQHASIEATAGGFRIIDRGSAAGTYRNRDPVQEALLDEGDTLWLGTARLFFHDGALKLFQPSRGVRVDALDVGRTLGTGRAILQHADIAISPGEFVAIVGPSGAGKTTLLRLLIGLDVPTTGEVFFDGVPLSRNFDRVRPILGYVPQQEIVHPELTVRESLAYSARLRLGADARGPGLARHVDRVLDQVRLTAEADSFIKDLSGGERKRASVAVELISEPRILFLDEPTSGLDPGLEDQLMHGFREMADAGRTVILTTHATRNVSICDRVIVVFSGHVVFTGTPPEALQHFAVEDFVQIYAALEDEGVVALDARFRDSAAYQRNVVARVDTLTAPAGDRRPHSLLLSLRRWPGEFVRLRRALATITSQCLQLFRRDSVILSRDRVNLALRLLGAPLLAGALVSTFDRTIFSLGESQGGNVRQAITLLYLMSAVSLFLGAISASSVITSEAAIFRMERLVNLSPVAYVGAKVAMLALFAVIQAGLMAAVVLPVIQIPPPNPQAESTVFGVLTLTTFAGMMMGLFISSVSPNTDRAAILAVLAIIPQLIFGGSTVPRSEMTIPSRLVSDATISKWSLELLGETTGIDRRIRNQSVYGLDLGPAVGGVVNIKVPTPFDNAFKIEIVSRWLALVAFAVLFIAGTLFVQSRKGRPRSRR